MLTLASLLASCPIQRVLAAPYIQPLVSSIGNFDYIYGNALYKKEFLDFLINVFHLYPENKLHALIEGHAKPGKSDEYIYKILQKDLPSIKPPLSDLTYALPALAKQKKVMAAQTVELLGSRKEFNNYLEVGSTGRYLDPLEEHLKINGAIYFLSELPSTLSPVDIIDRGQVCTAGKDIKLNNYAVNLNEHIPKNCIDLATVFIGFHHCPLNLREEFITSIRDTMTRDGVLILRDHNAYDEKMFRMVALAHDVFNMGTNESWDYNRAELRLFYSLEQLDLMMMRYGFKSDGRKLYQSGDPTLNALMLYRKS